jgi:nucleoside-diphosphate-sugar epimerase
METKVRGEALSLWRSEIRSDDRILITGSSGWLGRTALAMARDSRVPILATGSQDKVFLLDGIEQVVRCQDIELMAEFRPTIVIDTAFLTREKLETYGHKTYVSINQKLLQDSQALAQLRTVRKYVGFSSGAAVHLAGMDSFSLAQNPYAAQKQEYETTMANIDVRQGCDVTIARVWSVSGAYMTKPSSFAISNLIQQAKAGIIEILSSGPVYRRYCAIEDVVSISLAKESAPGERIFDTGGDLIELGGLAEIIRKEISPKIKILRKFDPMLRSDSYHSDGENWRLLSQKFGLGFDSIPNQVARMAKLIY